MAHRVPSAFAVRTVLVCGLTLATTSGCKHHRSALRPVYSAPIAAPAVIAPADPCPAPAVTPGFEDVDSPTLSPLPSAPPAAPIVPQSTEPGLRPGTPGLSEPPQLDGPRETRRHDRRRPATLTTRRSSYRAAVEPFVNDPNDLFVPPKADRPWRYIVLHHSAHATGGYGQIDREHRKTLGTDGCGYHFVIGNGSDSPDGQIEVARRWSDQKAGAHCRNARDPAVNEYGIGICLIGDLNQDQPTPKQIESARVLVGYLRERYRIAESGIGTHAHLAQGPTACPGKHFPVEAIVGQRGLAARSVNRQFAATGRHSHAH